MDDTKRAIANQSIDGTTDTDVLARLDKLEQQNQQLRETVENQQDQIDSQQDTIEELSERLDKARNATEYAHDRIDEIEPAASAKSSVEAGGKASENPENIDNISPLGQVVNIPEPEVDEHLRYENQKRARFIAKDIREYADMRKGDLVISTGDIKRVLSAKEERSIHWQTVGRVVDFLDSLGQEDTTVKDKRGTIVCFDPDAVAKWERGSVTPVVSGATGTV